MALIVSAGSHERFGFELSWRGRPEQRAFEFRDASGSAASRTRGKLVLWAGGRVVWGFERETRVKGLDWTWIDLLEHLARVWPYLCWEEGYPHGLGPASPVDLPAAAESAFAAISGPRREELERAIFDFREAHDLSFGLSGIRVPPLWIVTLGNVAAVATYGARIDLERTELFSILDALGTAISDRLSGCSDPRASSARAEWASRLKPPAEKLARIYTRLESSRLVAIRGRRSLESTFELSQTGPFEPTELLAVARSTASELADESLKALLDEVRSIGRSPTTKLDALTEEALAALREVSGQKPAEQAGHLARWLRAKLVLGIKPVDPVRFVRSLGVAIRSLSLETSAIDAVSVWGPRHGPAILLNAQGVHARGRAGSNSTVAHEICHLLIDRRGALPLAEVLTRTSLPVEARARAFAAEFLMPADAVAAAFASRTNPRRALKRLCRQFCVSPELVAWQARNSGAALSREAFALLRGHVSRPEAF